MSALADHLSDYLTLRRALGFALGRHGHDLQDFVAFLESAGAKRVTLDLAVAWARSTEQAKPITVDFRISAVRGFAQYLPAIDPAPRSRLQGCCPSRGVGLRRTCIHLPRSGLCSTPPLS